MYISYIHYECVQILRFNKQQYTNNYILINTDFLKQFFWIIFKIIVHSSVYTVKKNLISV